MGAGNGHLSLVSVPRACWLIWDVSSILWLCSPHTLGVSPVCESCFLSTPTLPPPEDSNTYLLRCFCPHPAPQIPGVRQLEHFCIRLILFFPLPPDGPLVSERCFNTGSRSQLSFITLSVDRP